MYCKQCGHRTEEKSDTCLKCGAKLSTDIQQGPAPKAKVRWHAFVIAVVIGVSAFVVLPRLFLHTELETIGPTDKLRFLRAMDHSEYRRIGQRELRLEGQTLVVIWDLRWNVLPEPKQRDIIRIVGRAWQVVSGDETRFRIEGEDDVVAFYRKGQEHLGVPP